MDDHTKDSKKSPLNQFQILITEIEKATSYTTYVVFIFMFRIMWPIMKYLHKMRQQHKTTTLYLPRLHWKKGMRKSRA
jgi:hypothetical protein